MDKTAKINNQLVEDALALETTFREAGLEEHARAIRIALQEAQEDIIKEQNYGTNTILNGIKSAANLYRSINAYISDESKNNDIINVLDHHIEDIDNIRNIEYAPKFVLSNNIPILQSLSSLISNLKTQSPYDKINNETKKLIAKLQNSIRGG